MIVIPDNGGDGSSRVTHALYMIHSAAPRKSGRNSPAKAPVVRLHKRGGGVSEHYSLFFLNLLYQSTGNIASPYGQKRIAGFNILKKNSNIRIADMHKSMCTAAIFTIYDYFLEKSARLRLIIRKFSAN